jgi:heme oxygenase (biliverdin-IX-beta and delta-forming)
MREATRSAPPGSYNVVRGDSRSPFPYNAMTKAHLRTLRGAIPPETDRHSAATVHRTLRAGTRDDHVLIDAMLLPLDLAKAPDYELYLSIHAESLQALAGIWRGEDSKDFQAMLGLLRSDLATLESPPSVRSLHACISASLGAGLGVAYVIRGSRLGAAVLRRSVPANMPTSYLDFVPSLPWRDFLPQLELLAGDAAGTQAAMLAARSTFAVFHCASKQRQAPS